MIILDTNVLSALMRDEPDRRVVTWLDGQAAASTWITSVTVFEVRLGLALLPEGRRRRTLAKAFDGQLEDDPDGRILSFDRVAASEAATLAATRQRAGMLEALNRRCSVQSPPPRSGAAPSGRPAIA